MVVNSNWITIQFNSFITQFPQFFDTVIFNLLIYRSSVNLTWPELALFGSQIVKKIIDQVFIDVNQRFASDLHRLVEPAIFGILEFN